MTIVYRKSVLKSEINFQYMVPIQWPVVGWSFLDARENYARDCTGKKREKAIFPRFGLIY